MKSIAILIFFFNFIYLNVANNADLNPDQQRLVIEEQNDIPNIKYYPKLIDVYVRFFDPDRVWRGRIIEEDDVVPLIRKNPNIRRLTLHGPGEYILRTASERLDLHYLGFELSEWNPMPMFPNVPKIIYKSVKTLQIKVLDGTRAWIERFPEEIEFERLEEFYATIDLKSRSIWWIEFIKRYPHFKKFHTIGGCVSNNNLKELSGVRHEMSEISIELCWNVIIQYAVNFVHRNQNVNRIIFTRMQNYGKSFESLVEALKFSFNETRNIIATAVSIELIRKN